MLLSAPAHGVRASIAYTMAPAPLQGEASPGPIVGSGVVRVESAGGSFAVPLASLGIDRRHWSIFPRSPQQGCGAGAPLAVERTPDGRDYVIVESIEVGKGCRADAHVIDVASRSVVPEYAADHASDHAGDIPPSAFVRQRPLTVTNVRQVTIPSGPPATRWTLTFVRGDGTEFFAANLLPAETPRIGERITLGVLHDQTFTAHLIAGDRIFRLSASHEQAWAAQQTPVPRALVRSRTYNQYFAYSDRLAGQGEFAQALAAYERALTYLDDVRLREAERKDVPRLAAIVRAARAKSMTLAQAKKAWFTP